MPKGSISHRIEAGVIFKIGHDAHRLVLASLGCLHQALEVAAGVDNQATTSLGKFDRNGLADPAGCPRYNGNKGFFDASHRSV